MSDAFDKAKAAETAAKAELAAAGVTLAAPTVTPRKRRTEAERLADLDTKRAELAAKVAEREKAAAERGERKELERKRRFFAKRDGHDMHIIGIALARMAGDPVHGEDIARMAREYHGEGA